MTPIEEAETRALIQALPPILTDDEIARICEESVSRSKGAAEYEYDGLTFVVPEHVSIPGATSRTIHDKLLGDVIGLKSKDYIAMGVGCGVEAVVAARKQARTVYAVDIGPESIQATADNFRRLIGADSKTRFHTFVSDLLSELPDNIQVDIITFNPPTVDASFSDDPDVSRTICAGSDVMTRLFAQTVAKRTLANEGEIIITVSNTSDLRGIVGSGVEQGFIPSILSLHTWPEPYDMIKTHVLRFRKPHSERRRRAEFASDPVFDQRGSGNPPLSRTKERNRFTV